jgi:ferredoxin/flavodoxin---NADP+ reductase
MIKTEVFTKILDIRHLTDSTYVVRMERNGLEFYPGQHLGLGLKDYPYMRDYSIYSGIDDDYLEVLVREVPDGNLSRKFKRSQPGDVMKIDGPAGSFGIEKKNLHRKFVFVASGTGIAPFHSFVRSFPNIDYQIIHGVRFASEAYESFSYADSRYLLCTSKDIKGHFQGRVTSYLRIYPIETDSLFYLCGNGEMVFEVNDILQNLGVPPEQIFFEVYF